MCASAEEKKGAGPGREEGVHGDLGLCPRVGEVTVLDMEARD